MSTNIGEEEVPLYQRYIGDRTELWFFGSGIGEYTMFQQMGDSFLTLIDQGEDPELGKIMFSIGHGVTAYMAYRGDYNVCWIWAIAPKEVNMYLRGLSCKQNLLISSEPEINASAEVEGLASLNMCGGINPRLFYPLGLERRGIAYAGLDNKSEHQRRIVVEPAMRRGGFEWVSRFKDGLMTIDQLNRYYNTKQIMLGMVDENRHNLPYIPTRVMETLATGTPLITYRLYEHEKTLGFHYPYMTESAEQTTELIDRILGDFDTVLWEMKGYAQKVVELHNYEDKLRLIFKALKETEK